MWWDIRKLVEPVETLSLEFAGYKPGTVLGGIALEYESTMVRLQDRNNDSLSSNEMLLFLCPADQVYGGYRARSDPLLQSQSQEPTGQNHSSLHWPPRTYICTTGNTQIWKAHGLQ